VPKGFSYDPADKHLAVRTEDHPLEYGRFQGVIPEGHYGAGRVVIWDHGWWEAVGDPRAGYRKGSLKFVLHGRRLRGGWALVRMRPSADQRAAKENWLLIKERDMPAAQRVGKPASRKARKSGARPRR